MNISEKVAYLKGLMAGLKIDEESDEGKLFKGILDVLEDMSYEIAELNENALDIGDELDSLGDELDAVSEDLEDVENEVFGCYDECCCDEDDECGCGCCDDGDDEDDDYVYEVTCPACGEDVIAEEEDLMRGEMDCPACGEHLEFEFDEIEDEESGETEE